MDKESIYRLGLDHITNIDIALSKEIYDPTNNNHIIFISLLKDNTLYSANCGQIGNYVLRSSRLQVFNHSSFETNNLLIKLKNEPF